jgi:UDP-N-acetylmuramyl pentapeptide phosphotransferase/UDP-N-acetylglucosamine-1-phosphate transferase
MNIFWLGLLLIVGSVFIFFIVIFRPASLKVVRRSGSKYHVSPLGATSCGVFCLVLGIASVLTGLSILSPGYLRWVLWLAIAQLGGVGCFDTYRNWKLGRHSPFYVGEIKK